MDFVRLGKSELMVSAVGFGGIPIQRLTADEAVDVVRACLDMGVNFIDTANGYSTSEERIGRAIADCREDVIIATKTGGRDKATALEHLELSLRRLDTDYIDLWQFHGVSTPEDYERVLGPGGAMEAAQAALEAGKVRHIGITSHSLDLALEQVASDLFETIMFPFNFVTSEPADELIPLALEHDVGFIDMKPMGGGLLEDAVIAFKYLRRFPEIVPIPGIERIEEMEEIVGIMEGPAELTDVERAKLVRLREELGNRFCRRCGYCMPCPEGVPIRSLMILDSIIKRMPPERLVGGWEETIAKVDDCVDCGECETKCPYDLPIRDRMAENIALYRDVMEQFAPPA